MLNTTINLKDSAKANAKLVNKLALVMYRCSEKGADTKNAQIANITNSYKDKSRDELLREIKYYEDVLDAKKKARLIAQEKLNAVPKANRKTLKKASKIDLTSPSKGQAPLVVTLDEAQKIINDRGAAYVKQCADTAGFVPSLAYVIPPGGGKSYSIAQMAVLCYMLGQHVVILTPNHDLADEAIESITEPLVKAVREEMQRKMATSNVAQEEIAKALDSVVHYRGRAPLNKKKGRTDLTCFQYESTAEAGEKNQPVCSSLCRTCPHGQAGEINFGTPESKEKAIQWFSRRKIDSDDYTSEEKVCKFLRIALPEQLAKRIIVAPTSAYSEAMNSFKDEDGKTTLRLVIVDENVSLNRRVEVLSETVTRWNRSLEALIADDNDTLQAKRQEVHSKTLTVQKQILDALKNGEFSDETAKAFQAIASKKFFASYKTIESDMQTLQAALQVLKASGELFNECWNWQDTITKAIEDHAKTTANNSEAIRIHTRTLELLRQVNSGFGNELYSRRAANQFKSVAAKKAFHACIDALVRIKDDLQKLKEQKQAQADEFIEANGLVEQDAFEHGTKVLKEAGITACNQFFKNTHYTEISEFIERADEIIVKLGQAKGDNAKALFIMQSALATLKVLADANKNGYFTNGDSSSLEIVTDEIEYKLLVREMLAVKKELQERDLVTGGIGRFEKINYFQEVVDNETVDHFKIPLRAFCDLAQAMQTDQYIATIGKFSFVIHVATQIANRALEKGRVIFADATMPEELQCLVECRGGEVIRLNVAQNIHITRVQGHRYSQGIASKDRERKYKMHMQDMLAYAPLLKESENNLPWAFLTHKGVWEHYARANSIKAPETDIFNAPVLQEFFSKTGVKAGWFNRHDRGHNEWKFFNLAIFGQINLSQTSIATQYEAARAVMLACGNERWGAWDGAMTDISTGNCIPIDDEDQLDVDGQVLKYASKAKLWYFKWLVANLVQGIGRSRAVISKKQIECYLFGGINLPEIDVMLGEYGIQIAETIENTVHRTREKYNTERGAPKNLIDEVAINMQQQGEMVSVRSVKAKIESQEMKTSLKTVEARLKFLRDSNMINAATKGGKATQKAYIEAKAVADKAFERIALDTKQAEQFKQKILEQVFSGQCDLDSDDETAIIDLSDTPVQVYKVGTDFYRECAV